MNNNVRIIADLFLLGFAAIGVFSLAINLFLYVVARLIIADLK